MNTKKILIGLIGGALAGYLYNEFFVKSKPSKTVSEGIKETVETIQDGVQQPNVGSIGGGGVTSPIPTTSSESQFTTTPVRTETPTSGTTSGTIKIRPATLTDLDKENVASLPLAPTPTPTINTFDSSSTPPTISIPRTTVTQVKMPTLGNVFSGFGGQQFECGNSRLDL